MCVLAMTENSPSLQVFGLGKRIETDSMPHSAIAAEKGQAGETPPGVGVTVFLASRKEPISANVR